jgi:hypothetical protein
VSKKTNVNKNRPPATAAKKSEAPRPAKVGAQGPMYRGAKDTPLLRAMTAAGWSARELALRLGCSPWSVGRWLDGDRPIPHYRACIRALLGAEAMPE